MSDKVIALRTLMVRGMVFLKDQQVPFLEKVQLERLVEAGAVEVIKEKKTRKKRAKTPPKQTQVIDETPSDNHTQLEVAQEEEKSEVVEEDTISLDHLDF